MKNYEDKIYSLGETVTGQTRAMSLSQALNQFAQNLGRYQYARSLISQPFPICGIVRFCSKGCRVVIENRSLHTTVHTPIVT